MNISQIVEIALPDSLYNAYILSALLILTGCLSLIGCGVYIERKAKRFAGLGTAFGVIGIVTTIASAIATLVVITQRLDAPETRALIADILKDDFYISVKYKPFGGDSVTLMGKRVITNQGTLLGKAIQDENLKFITISLADAQRIDKAMKTNGLIAGLQSSGNYAFTKTDAPKNGS